MEEAYKSLVYSKNTIEFVTVAVQYCAFLETFEIKEKEELTDKLVKILPLLYLKALLIPETEMSEEEEELEITVREEDYNYIAGKLFDVFGKDDTYLEVFLEDMKYSDTPVSASMSEDLADIYQDLKNFVSVFEHGIINTMNDALYICRENFTGYWGQKLVNVLGALHALRFPVYSEVPDDDTYNTEDSW